VSFGRGFWLANNADEKQERRSERGAFLVLSSVVMRGEFGQARAKFRNEIARRCKRLQRMSAINAISLSVVAAEWRHCARDEAQKRGFAGQNRFAPSA
jgi:hypothetical protein